MSYKFFEQQKAKYYGSVLTTKVHFNTGTINQPTVDYCISVYDGTPVLRVLSQVGSKYMHMHMYYTLLHVCKLIIDIVSSCKKHSVKCSVALNIPQMLLGI